MAKIFPVDFEEKLTMAQDDYILFSDSEDGNKIKKAQYSNLKWDKWDKGDTGATGATGATWPQWPEWPTWPQWPAGTITVGTVTTWAAGTDVAITNTGTSSAAVLNFTIPQGVQWEPWTPWADWADGADGADWEAATITVGTTTTLSPWSSATVTNVGTSSAAILNFWIPKGESWTGSWDVSWPASSTDWHLAVFDWATGKLIKDWGSVPTSFAPDSAGSEWQVLTKWASGYDWATVSGWDVQVSTDTGNLLSTGVKLWLWDKADFDNLWTLDTNTIYAPIEWIVYPRGIPAEYQEVEYIQSDWTQYINLGWNPTSNYFKVESKARIYKWSYEWGVLFWMTNWSKALSLQVHTTSGPGMDSGWYANIGPTVNIKPSREFYSGENININFVWDSWNYTLDLNRDHYTGTYNSTVVQATRPFYLFAFNENWSITWKTYMKLYSFKLYSWESTLIRDLVPCYRIADSVIGLYDLVNDTFYTNDGTGTFTKWGNIS